MVMVMDRTTERTARAAGFPGLRRWQAMGWDGAASEPVRPYRDVRPSVSRLMSADPVLFTDRQQQPEGE